MHDACLALDLLSACAVRYLACLYLWYSTVTHTKLARASHGRQQTGLSSAQDSTAARTIHPPFYLQTCATEIDLQNECAHVVAFFFANARGCFRVVTAAADAGSLPPKIDARLPSPDGAGPAANRHVSPPRVMSPPRVIPDTGGWIAPRRTWF